MVITQFTALEWYYCCCRCGKDNLITCPSPTGNPVPGPQPSHQCDDSVPATLMHLSKLVLSCVQFQKEAAKLSVPFSSDVCKYS